MMLTVLGVQGSTPVIAMARNTTTLNATTRGVTQARGVCARSAAWNPASTPLGNAGSQPAAVRAVDIDRA